MRPRDFVEVDVKHCGRVTHKIIGGLDRQDWLTTAKQEALKQRLFAMAIVHYWVLEGREIGDAGRTGFTPTLDQEFLAADDGLGLTLWQVDTM